MAELAAVGLGSLIVPLPGAIADEQTANANYLVDAGAATCIAQDVLTPEMLAGQLGALTRERAQAMAVAARALGRGDAAQRIATICMEFGTR